MLKPDYDYLLIGQGLAGSILAYKLIKRGLRVLVADNHHQHSASIVAAGIINPITGRRLSLSEDFESHFSSADDFYKTLEAELNCSLYHRVDQQRLLHQQTQFDYYQQRRQQARYQNYLSDWQSMSAQYPAAEFGAVSIHNTAVVDSKSLLNKLQNWFIANDSYLDCKIDFQALRAANGNFKVAGKTAKNIIFCEGYQAINNPWLQHLPFKLAKGEILNIELKQSPLSMLNWGNWLLPSVDQASAKLGASFDWQDLSLEPNPDTHKKLLDDLAAISKLHATLQSSEVGIRPATISRIPFIGAIPELANGYCFNGFGSKGCLQIPYYADLMSEFLIGQAPLPEPLTKWL